MINTSQTSRNGLRRTRYGLIILVIVALAIGAWIISKKKSGSSGLGRAVVINKNISPELEELAENTVVYLALKDSFVAPQDYLLDSQLVDTSIILYPKDQKNVVYSGLESLSTFKGIFISSANTVKDEMDFKTKNEQRFAEFKKDNPESDATMKVMPEKIGGTKYVIKQTKPFKMVDTLLRRELIIEIISTDETDAYKQIVDTYKATELISASDHKAIQDIQRNLVIAYEKGDVNKAFESLSTTAQADVSIREVETSVKNNSFKDMISLEPTILSYFDRNFVMQSRVLFDDNMMVRLNISFKVDYDGKRNHWSVDSYSIGAREKYLTSVESL